MRAIVEFRQKCIRDQCWLIYNVAGRGLQPYTVKTCALWGQMQSYGYWSTVYNLTSAKFDKLMQKHGTPYIQKRGK